MSYLLVVDYYSCYIEVAKLSSTTFPAVINHLKSIFARHGIPEVVRSDNGQQYSTNSFDRFAKEYGFTHNPAAQSFLKAMERQKGQ